MWTGELRVSGGVSAAAWIAPRLEGAFGAVTRTVPKDYPAYVRICHPVRDSHGGWATWSQVAETTGRQAHPLMQWHALVGSPDPVNMRGSLWSHGNPERGNLVPEVLGALCDLLTGHTATPNHCYFCLWEGWGWIWGSPAVLGPDGPIPPAFSPEEWNRPRVHLPSRDYLLLVGPLSAALQIGWRPTAHRFDPQSPNLFWPSDQAWCVASEIDLDSTLVGGTPELVDAILDSPTFDAWPIQPDDSLAAATDLVNCVPFPDPDILT